MFCIGCEFRPSHLTRDAQWPSRGKSLYLTSFPTFASSPRLFSGSSRYVLKSLSAGTLRRSAAGLRFRFRTLPKRSSPLRQILLFDPLAQAMIQTQSSLEVGCFIRSMEEANSKLMHFGILPLKRLS
jgi:hypothetical protein